MKAPSPAPLLALAVAVTLAFAPAACGGKHASSPRPAAPALFASIPADTPYVVASFEPIPLEVLATYRDVLGGAMRSAFERPGGEALDADDDYARLVAAFLAELDGKWTAAGVESLGLSATPRFALHGLGLSPVLRLEIRDGARLFATIERIAARAKISLPPPVLRDGRRYWRIDVLDRVMIVAITGDQLVLAYVPAARIDAALPLLLGTERPARNMADGAELAAARAKHRLGAQAVGLVDARRLAAQLLGDAHPAPACTAEIDRLTSRIPRIVAGYAISRAAHDTALVVELAPDLVGELRAMRVALPGLAEAAAGRPLMMFAGGVDLARAQGLAVAAAEAIGRTAAACGIPSVAAGARSFGGRLGQPLPPPIAQLQGAVLSLASLELMDGPVLLPLAAEGFALASSAGAVQLFELLQSIVLRAAPVELAADGKLHPIPPDGLPFRPPFRIFAGATPRVVGLAAGRRSPARAEQAMAAPPAPAPFFVTDGDYGRLLELRARFGKDREMDTAQAKLYGRMHGSVDVTDRGLEMRASFETK